MLRLGHSYEESVEIIDDPEPPFVGPITYKGMPLVFSQYAETNRMYLFDNRIVYHANITFASPWRVWVITNITA